MPTAWYRCPYIHRQSGPRVERYVAMDAHTAAISVGNGAWEESEIDGDQALVRVRARPSVLADLALLFPQLSDAEAEAAWTPQRATPMRDPITGDVVFDTSTTHPTKPLADVVRRVPEQAQSGEVLGLLSAWAGIGFGLGFRLPSFLCLWLATQGIAPGHWWLDTLLKTLCDQRGAFPTAGVLDAFTRANASSLGANWTVILLPGSSGNGPQIISNMVGPDQAADYDFMYWNPATFGPDVEVYETITTKITTNGHPHSVVFLTTVGVSTVVDGYGVDGEVAAGTDVWKGIRIDNGVSTQLGATVTQEITSGDGIGLERIGSNVNAQYRTGGTWSQLLTRSDSTYSAVGNVGFYAASTDAGAWRIDDFGGGTIISPPVRRPPLLFGSLFSSPGWLALSPLAWIIHRRMKRERE